MKRCALVLCAVVFLFSLVACNQQQPERFFNFAPDDVIEREVDKISAFPNLPSSYTYFDYQTAARKLDAIAFSFASDPDHTAPNFLRDDQSTWSPAGFWVKPRVAKPDSDPLVYFGKDSFGMPTYIGDRRSSSDGQFEYMTTIPMVLGASYAGVDKSAQQIGDQVFDFVEMTMSAYDSNSRLIHNIGAQGQSFWYDLFPQITFARLYDLYPDTPYMQQMVLNGAEEWLEALPYFVTDGEVDFEFVGFNVVFDTPTRFQGGGHIEPPNGGLAFLFYSALQITGDERFLGGAKFVLDYFESYQRNPNYEAMTDYAPFVAAALNYRYGTNYDVGKFLDFVFEGDSAFRSGWTVMNGSFGGYPVHGLVGQDGDYAFSMNTFHLASVLAPMVKYQNSYATAFGKYLLNVASNSRWFFPQQLPLGNQSMNNHLAFDPDGSICYEGFRNRDGGYAMGDATAMFGQPCDISLYSASHTGYLGGIVAPTDVNGILRIDLNKTDSFGLNKYQYYLYYNPHSVDKLITFDAGSGADLFNTLTKTIEGRNVSGSIKLKIPAGGASVIAVLPTGSVPTREGNDIMLDGYKLAEYSAAVNLPNINTTRQTLNNGFVLQLAVSTPSGDPATNMVISFGGIEVYNGEPITAYTVNKSLLPDTDYELRVQITTQSGITAKASKRVVCL